mmetsp:Transcript_6011/g.17012  ORF Transcript_6011/g.17012 Transcript_6011/m.17012 type:complete len:232 (-) Transcript_6011:297-992(-)
MEVAYISMTSLSSGLSPSRRVGMASTNANNNSEYLPDVSPSTALRRSFPYFSLKLSEAYFSSKADRVPSTSMSCPSFVPQPAMLSCRNSTSKSSEGVKRHLTRYGKGESQRNPDSSDLSTGNNALPCFASYSCAIPRSCSLDRAVKTSSSIRSFVPHPAIARSIRSTSRPQLKALICLMSQANNWCILPSFNPSATAWKYWPLSSSTSWLFCAISASSWAFSCSICAFSPS